MRLPRNSFSERVVATRPTTAVVVSAVALMASVPMMLFLGDKSIWLDESYSIARARLDWTSLSELMPSIHMSLYYLLLHIWVKLGHGEVFVRSLSVVFAVAALPVIYALGRRIAGSGAGFMAMLLLSMNAFFVQYAQEARSYSLLVLLTTLSSYFFLRGIEGPSWRVWVGYIVSVGFTIYAHPFGAFVLIAHAASLAFLPLRVVPWRTLAAVWLGITLLWLPWIRAKLDSYSAGGEGASNWIPQPELADIPNLFYTLSGSLGAVSLGNLGLDVVPGVTTGVGHWAATDIKYLLAAAYLIPVAIAAGIALKTRFGSGASYKTWRVAFLFTWLIVPVTIGYSLSAIDPIFIPRYFITTLPALVLLVSVGITSLHNRWIVLGALAIVLALSGRGLFHWYAEYEKEDWKGAASYVLSNARRGDAVTFYAPWVNVPFEYYLERLGPPDSLLTIAELSPHIVGAALDGDVDESSLFSDEDLFEGQPAGYYRLWLVLAHADITTLGGSGQSRFVQNLIEREYTPSLESRFHGVRVVLYEKDNTTS